MEPPKSDAPKLTDMVMCGDHPSFTKPELGVKEVKTEEKERTMSYARISPSASRTERTERTERELRARGTSEHALRLLEARRRLPALPAEPAPRLDPDAAAGNRALVQAALGSFRWPPYLLAVWVLVLVLTHVLHCLVNMLERAIPALKRGCQYFRAWTEESWKGEAELNQRVCPLALACATGALYALYFLLCGALALALWAVEPLCADADDKRGLADAEPRGAAYLDEASSKTNASLNQ